MKRTEFEYDLPDELIAQEALAKRDASRMLVLDRAAGTLAHRAFGDLPGLVRGDEVIVYNNSRVIPARMWARKPTGGRVEVLALRMLAPGRLEAMTNASKPVRPGQALRLERTGEVLQVVDVPAAGRAVLETAGEVALEVVRREGTIPLPPYIRREPGADDSADRDRYQTMFAQPEGSVAAPTAGLHFTPDVVAALEAKGCELCPVTLHVGPGTFQPVRAEQITDHRMEREYFTVPEATAVRVNEARRQGRPVLAVGTTSVRTLETAGAGGELQPGDGHSELFIYPGYPFRIVDRLLTNFHLPGSTLIMLVSALAGRERVLSAYEEAVRHRYRFYSYGDCMLIV